MNENTSYFESYADLEVHKVMLNDAPRNEAYKNAILANKDYFTGKTVLDVGTGTGILSVFCAQAGASKVYAVDASNVINIAKLIVTENNVQDVVEIIQGKIEDIQLPEKVDIIISEWMGFYLLHEAMLDSVLVARDKFLKPNGAIFPNKCQIYAAPCALPTFYSQWDDICNVKMNSFGSQLRKLYYGKPEITQVPEECLLAEENCLVEFSLEDLSINDLDELSCKLFTICKNDCKCQGICIWFSVTFPSLMGEENDIVFSTAPKNPVTHWKQTVIVMPDEIELEEGEPLVGVLNLRKSKNNPRFYDIEFTILDSNEEEHPVPCNCCFTTCKIIKALSAQYDEQDEECELIEVESKSS